MQARPCVITAWVYWISFDKILAMPLIIWGDPYHSSAWYKRLQAARRNQQWTMERTRSLWLLAAVLAGKRLVFLFCRSLPKQELSLITAEELLEQEVLFSHGKGESRHGLNSTWCDFVGRQQGWLGKRDTSVQQCAQLLGARAGRLESLRPFSCWKLTGALVICFLWLLPTNTRA